ncbi:MAG: VIT1/CCC1 transporter family protein [Candidatus Acetothermia bacterium]
MNLRDLELSAAIRGLMDGTLSTLGVVIGAQGAAPEIIIAAGISGGIANSFSNIFAAFTAYETELVMKVNSIKNSMLRKDMRNTEVYEQGKREVNKQSLADGVATAFGALVPVLPYFFFSARHSVYIAVGLTAVLGLLVGLVMGSISKRSLIRSGIKMAVSAIVVGIISAFVQMGLSSVLPKS